VERNVCKDQFEMQCIDHESGMILQIEIVVIVFATTLFFCMIQVFPGQVTRG